MIDHCVSAFNCRQEEKLYRAYVTDALGIIVGANERWINQIAIEKEHPKSAEEIKNDIRSKFRK